MYSNKKVFEDQRLGGSCVYIGGLTESTANDINGLGKGIDGDDWVPSTGTIDFSSLGAKKLLDGDAELTFNIPAELQATLATRGAFQFDFDLSDLTSRNDLTALTEFLRIRSAAVANEGIQLRTLYQTNDVNSYARLAEDISGTQILINPISLQLRSGGADTNHSTPHLIFHDEIETDSEGKVTLGCDWTGARGYWYVNGIPWDEFWRGIGGADPVQHAAFSQLALQRAMKYYSKNLLIFNEPFEKFRDPSNTIVGVGHSFLEYMEGLHEADRAGRPGIAFSYSTDLQISSQLYKGLDFGFDYRCISLSNQNLTDISNLVDSTTAFAYDDGVGTYRDTVDRHVPSVVILCGTLNGTGAGFASEAAGIHSISGTLMAQGIIPVWLVEQNNPSADKTVVHTAVINEIERQQAVNDMGKVDMWDVIGDTTDGSYIAYGQTWDPNYKATRAIINNLVTEINRLYNNPPPYARWSGKNVTPTTIAAP